MAEMAALEKAKEILTSVNVLTQYDDPYEGDDTTDDSKWSLTRQRLVAHLKSIGHRYNNYGMLEIACSAADDSFDKIRGLIADMIEKLVQEANEEANQKAFCDDAIKKSKKDQADKSMVADKLKA